MSLHTLAHHLQSAGRGDDKVLVHMTPKEVGGLQALAHAHGGSLTINPHTGLPEAGFLSSLLPMIAGGLLTMTGVGAPMAALMVGGGTALATGSLGKGLMAGLGAYGGAGLASGLSNVGATQMANAAYAPQAAQYGQLVQNLQNFNPAAIAPAADATATVAGSTVGNVAGSAAGNAATSTLPTVSVGPAPYASAVSNTVPVGAPVPASSAMFAAPGAAPPITATPLPGSADVLKAIQTPVSAVTSPVSVASPASGLAEAPSAMDKIGAGLKTANSWQGIKDIYAASQAAAPYSGMASLGSMAMQARYDQQADAAAAARAAAKKGQGMIRPYEFNRTVNESAFDKGPPMWADQPGSSAERRYFNDSYTALTPYKAPGPEYQAAKGGLMSFAVGGPVEQMSAQNAVGDNQMYPQAGLQTAMYSNPMMQRPMAQNVIQSGVDTNVDPYTGEQRFALGGLNSSADRELSKFAGATSKTSPGYQYSYNPDTLEFTQISKPVKVSTASTGPVAVGGRTLDAWQSQPTGIVTGGMLPPTMRSTSDYQPYTQASIPAYQSPEQQLGLGSFYNDMNSQLSAMGYADGGTTSLRAAPMNAKMAAIDAARAKMQTMQGRLEMEKAARDGDYSAQLALQQSGYDLNDLNQYAAGGISHLGDYSDGGRLLKGPGDGVSDSIPAVIGNRQPARLADGEFVIPARIVSELGNGSTDAGAKRLYAMMDRVQNARRKTTGKNRVAANTDAEKYLPA